MIWLWLCALLQATAPADVAPGLKLTFESLDQNVPSKIRDARISRLAAINVPRGTSASPFLTVGPFQATFEGFINLKLRGEFTFIVQGRGEVELLVNGQPVLKTAGDDLGAARSDRVRLRKGPNLLELRYASPPGGDATMRLYWSEKDRAPEPVSPIVLTHRQGDASLQESLELRRGRELVAELRCVQCHPAPFDKDREMPELRADAPSLTEVGARLNEAWMARWISDPKSIRADASMPRLFRGPKDRIDPRAGDIAAYLATLGADPPAIDFKANDGVVGARLFTALGCIACHNDADLPLGFIRDKWKPAALVEYLRVPQKNYAWTRMPNFKLSNDEARALAAFLIDSSTAKSEPLDARSTDMARGKADLVFSGCLDCHLVKGEIHTHPAKALIELSKLNGGCLGDSERAPEFALSDENRARVRTFLEGDRTAVSRDTPIDFAERQMRQLNCIACHARDTQTDTWSSLKSQVEAIESKYPLAGDVLPMSGDQSRPSLTWIGEKLRAEWSAMFIAGEIDYKPRPWLAARMPSFPARAKGIARGLAHEHGLPFAEEEASQPVDPKLADIGRKLVGKTSGFACIACHAIGGAPATSAFEAQGPNFVYTHDRMRGDFYRRWVRNPQRYEPGTRMPQYGDAHGKTALKDFESGDAERQFDAIWQYLCLGEKMSPPD